jgi:hypothetical protein
MTLEAHANTNETNLWGPLIWILLSEVPRMLAQNERELVYASGADLWSRFVVLEETTHPAARTLG